MKAPAPSITPSAVTAQYDFFNATSDGDKLFSVRGGVPLRDAFDQLSLLLSSGHSALDDVCAAISADEVPQSQWAAAHVLDFAYALVQSMHHGLIEHERPTVQPSDPTPLHAVV